MSTEDEVRATSKRFYEALTRMANGDGLLLGEVWSQDADVTAMHPIGGRHVGWAAVQQSFNQVADAASDGKVELTEQRIRVLGDVAYEVGVEKGQFKLGGHQAIIDIRVTNIYQRQGGAWKLVHHHTDTSPSMLEILRRL